MRWMAEHWNLKRHYHYKIGEEEIVCAYSLPPPVCHPTRSIRSFLLTFILGTGSSTIWRVAKTPFYPMGQTPETRKRLARMVGTIRRRTRIRELNALYSNITEASDGKWLVEVKLLHGKGFLGKTNRSITEVTGVSAQAEGRAAEQVWAQRAISPSR